MCAAEDWHQLVMVINEATSEVKYFATNAVEELLERMLRVSFPVRRSSMHFALPSSKPCSSTTKCRQYVGLLRKLVMTSVTRLNGACVATSRQCERFVTKPWHTPSRHTEAGWKVHEPSTREGDHSLGFHC